MQQPNGQPPASPFQEKMRAKLLLGRLDRHADLAETIEQLEQTHRESSDAVGNRVIGARIERLRALYQRAIGLPPEQRHMLRAGLGPIMETGRDRVTDLLARLREADTTRGTAGETAA